MHNERLSSNRVRLTLPDPAATAALGRALADALKEHLDRIHDVGFQINLSGDLGAGKTSLVRALLRGFDVSGPIKSPTFTLLEPYKVSSLDFYHFDFYRFTDPAEFGFSGFRDLFGPGRICAIEWPEKAGSLPTADLTIALIVDGDRRVASIVADSELGEQCLTSAAAHYRMKSATSRGTGSDGG